MVVLLGLGCHSWGIRRATLLALLQGWFTTTLDSTRGFDVSNSFHQLPKWFDLVRAASPKLGCEDHLRMSTNLA